MVVKLDYATRSRPTACRSARELLLDVIAGSGMVVVGLFITVLLAVAAEGFGSSIDEIFERPRNMVRRGAVRIGKGRETAKH